MTTESTDAAPEPFPYRITPADHLGLKEIEEHLWEARRLLGCEDLREDGNRWNGAAPTQPPESVDGAAFELSRAIELLSYTRDRYGDDAEGIAEADRMETEEAQDAADSEARYDAEDARRKAAGEPSEAEEAQARLAAQGGA